ncbi:MAG: hypothetical protein U5K73_04655 [Halofilum sp. (in: g-proteobacteria)]|nr:hypothetical protein [Halofilum sp. (in: g-proteobacteria)]
MLAPAIDDAMLDQLELLREQLHWQKEIDTVPHTLTEDAVTPFYRDSITGVGRGDLSADQAVWIRHQIGKIGKRK